MWNGKNKALTFSYDDGINYDARLAEIFDKYGMKCTFNINGSTLRTRERLANKPWKYKNAVITRLSIEDMQLVYKNHEVALHSYTHPHLDELPRELCRLEIVADQLSIETFLGRKAVGMAYPCGTFNDTVRDVLCECGVKYSRTVNNTYNFDLPENLLVFNPTCHHNSPRLMDLAREFVEMKTDTPKLFTVWGHSNEFEGDENWHVIEEFCEFMANRDDIFYGTNSEVLL